MLLSTICLGGNLPPSPINCAVGQVVSDGLCERSRLGWDVCAHAEVHRLIWVHEGLADTALDRKPFFL